SGALDCVLNLKGWKYDLKLLEAHKDSMMESDILQFLDSDRKNKLGFVAQEVMEVLPEAVDYDSITDVYAIYYTHLLPILVEAIKEQQAAIEDLKQQIINSGSLKSAEISSTSSGDLDIDQQPTTLFQNAPNPFSEGTKIKYYLEEQVGTGTIFIYDMNGRQLRSNELHHKGSGEISINSGELDAGMYMYTLITDGQVVGTKQMILTK
ncbi:MAG TPA: T9SS type A sorting domain-containing protein, partial [Candidatus Cloacimonetes bacterium]|nr:T9SS type A sorting domain-containing protein [Candidatus Cloacimonadota bacterium]